MLIYAFLATRRQRVHRRKQHHRCSSV